MVGVMVLVVTVEDDVALLEVAVLVMVVVVLVRVVDADCVDGVLVSLMVGFHLSVCGS